MGTEGIAAMSQSYVLYGRPGSGSVAVQIALEEIGAAYERVWVGREPADIDRFRAINPAGRVPALKLPDGTVMFESAAILVHLALAHPTASLAPAPGNTAHARFLQWMVYLSANVYEAALRIYYPARYTTRGEADSDVVKAQGALDFLQSIALPAGSLGPYLLGETFSIADVYLHMLASWYPEPAELEARLPALRELARRIGARASVAKVEADHAQS